MKKYSEILEIIKGDLYPREKVYWLGQPKPELKVHLVDLLPLMAGLCIFILGIVTCVHAVLHQGHLQGGLLGQNGIFFAGAVVIFSGILVALGKPISFYFRQRNMYYALTNLRILIEVRRSAKNKEVRSLLVKEIKNAEPLMGKRGQGTIQFIPSEYFEGEKFAFENIMDADKVYELITDMKS